MWPTDIKYNFTIFKQTRFGLDLLAKNKFT